MGAGEESTAAQAPKPASSAQETPATPLYPDWSQMQAYYGASGVPPPFFASTVGSPTPHPYMWAGQPLMPPYGAYPAMYPHAGVYAHPSMPMTSGTMQPNVDMEVKASDGKERDSSKKSKGNSGNLVKSRKAGEGGKVVSGSGNDCTSHSADTGSEGSTDATDENTNNQGLPANKKGSFHQMLADAANTHNSTVQGQPVSMPATNLKVGMDLWSTTPGVGTVNMRPNPAAGSNAIVPVNAGTLDGVMPCSQWIPEPQDERELKRQKRKQSNRESARRSRLRKQAECDELQVKVDKLNGENHDLKKELQRLSEECVRLSTENTSIKEELTRVCVADSVAKRITILHPVTNED